LLAILRTLERGGYVVQQPGERRYMLGLPLVALARRAANGLLPEALFMALGGPTAERLGQTVSLWALQGFEAVLVAAAEGPRQVRFAPRPGLRWPAAGSAVGLALLAGFSTVELARWCAQAAAVEVPVSVPPLASLAESCAGVRERGFVEDAGTLEPGLYLLAVPVHGTWRGAPLAIAYAAADAPPAQDLALILAELRELASQVGLATQQAIEPARAQDGRVRSVWLPAAAGPMSPPELQGFLDGPWLATLACLKEQGYPHTVPVWYAWDGSVFWLVAHARAEWAAHVRRNPRVSLAIGEPEPPLRRVLVEGLVEVAEAPGGSLVAGLHRRMADRYLGADAGAYMRAMEGIPRWLFRVQPEKMLTWRGLAPHPRYTHVDDPQDADARRAEG
jgi:PPOX class probable F420-dependent enzyme